MMRTSSDTHAYKAMAGEEGMTLIELIVVVSIISILAIAMGFQFFNWKARYNLENQLKEMYSDLMDARTNAMPAGLAHFAVFPLAKPRKYLIYKDTDPAPYGDGSLDAAKDTLVREKELDCKIKPDTRQFSFHRNGLIRKANGDLASTIKLQVVDLEDDKMAAWEKPQPDYDCLLITATRIDTGVIENGICKTR